MREVSVAVPLFAASGLFKFHSRCAETFAIIRPFFILPRFPIVTP